MTDEQALTRRRALGVTVLGAGAPILAACGDDTPAGGTSASRTPADPASSVAPSSSAATSPTTTASESTSPPTSAATGEKLVAVSAVPVGSGVVLREEQVVVTQPTKGEFRAFTAVCTHAQCIVASVDTQIFCDCHGSRYSIETGVPTPESLAEEPLAATDIDIVGGQVVRS